MEGLILLAIIAVFAFTSPSADEKLSETKKKEIKEQRMEDDTK